MKVKRILLAAAALGMLCALPGCNNRADDTVQKVSQEQTLQPMQQSWRGVLPCADCEGIETTLFLNQDGTWIMNERYLNAPKGTVAFGSRGRWARTAEKLVLTDDKGHKRYFRAKGDKLEAQSPDGKPLSSGRRFMLEPIKAPLPATPIAMRGMYIYTADVAIFTDCATGKRMPVANTVQLEQGYAAARGNSEKPVLISIKAHFTLEPNPDTEKLETVLVPDGSGEFIADGGCNS